MNDEFTTAEWMSEVWREGVRQWVGDVLVSHKLMLSGPITQPHVRPWSTVLRVPTNAGNYFFKAVEPDLAHEVVLTKALAMWLPDDTLQPLAVSTERAWMLLPDGGPRLRERFRADRDIAHWARVLQAYAEVQIALADRLPALLGLGVPDRRLATLPVLYNELVANVCYLHIAADIQITASEHTQLVALAPRLAEWCDELAALPIPESLNHGDLHDGNIFVGQRGPVFFDWGDANITHPFMSMRTVFVSVETALDLPEGGASSMPFVEAYLEPWQRFASASQVQHGFERTQRIAPLLSALSWYHAVASLPDKEHGENAAAVAHLLREFLQKAA